MIRKTLVLGLLTLVALAAVAPALTGLYLEREFDDVIARFERPGVTRVMSSRFSRGWFRSEASLRVGFDDTLCAQRPCPAVTLGSVIHHGPIPFTAPEDAENGLRPVFGVAVTRIDAAALWPRLVFEPALESLRLVTRVGFRGYALSTMRAEGGSFDISRKSRLAHVEMAALSGRLKVPLGGDKVDGSLEWPQFEIVGENGGQLSWRGLSASTGGDAASGQQIRAESLRIADGQGSAALLQELEARWQPLPAAPGRLAARFGTRVSRLVINNSASGPLIVQGALHAIDTDDWTALRTRLATLRDPDTGAVNARASAELYEQILPRLLADGPRIDLERLVLRTPDGAIRGYLHVAAPAEPRPARLLADLISQLELDFEGRVPKPLARDLAVQAMLANGRPPYALTEADIDRSLAGLVERGLIEAVDGGESYRLRLRIEQGLLTLNGRTQPGWQSVVDQFEAARERL